MMAGGDGKRAVAGGLARHIPVLARQTFEQLGVHDGVYIDGTFGAGGHTGAILRVGGTKVIGIDRDRDAIAGGFALVDEAEGRLTLVEDRFSNLEHVAHSLRASYDRTIPRARQVLLASVVYLPVLYGLLVLDGNRY